MEIEQTPLPNGGHRSEMGDVREIVMRMGSSLEDEASQSEGCNQLQRLVGKDGCSAKVVFDAGGLDVVTQAMRTHSSSPHMLKMGFGCLGRFAQGSAECQRDLFPSEQCTEILMKGGAMDVVLQGIREHPGDVTLQSQGCLALSRLADAGPSSREAMVGGGVVSAVVSAMKTHPRSPMLQVSGFKALRSAVSNNDKSRRQLFTDDGLQVVLESLELHIGSARVQRWGMKALQCLLCAEKASQMAVINAGAVAAVVGAMRQHLQDTQVLLIGCQTLVLFVYPRNTKENATAADIDDSTEFARAVLNHGGFAAVLSAMRQHPHDRQVQLAALRMLRSLIWTVDTVLAVVNYRGLRDVVCALERERDDLQAGRSPDLAICACSLLGTVARAAHDAPIAGRSVLEAGGAAAVAASMRRHSANRTVQALGSKTLLAIAQFPEATGACASGGVAQALVGGLRAADREVRAHCTAALACISARVSDQPACEDRSALPLSARDRLLWLGALEQTGALAALLAALEVCAAPKELADLLMCVANTVGVISASAGDQAARFCAAVRVVVGRMQATQSSRKVLFAGGLALSELLRTCSEEVARALVECGGLATVIEGMVAHCEGAQELDRCVQCSGCRVLAAVAATNEVFVAVDAGAVQAVVRALHRIPPRSLSLSQPSVLPPSQSLEDITACSGIRALGLMVTSDDSVSAPSMHRIVEAVTRRMMASVQLQHAGLSTLAAISDVDRARKLQATEAARQQRSLSGSEGHSGADGLFQRLPTMVLAQLWPPERVMLGRRVCGWLRKALLAHAPAVVMQARAHVPALKDSDPAPNAASGLIERAVCASQTSSITLRCTPAPEHATPSSSASHSTPALRQAYPFLLDGLLSAVRAGPSGKIMITCLDLSNVGLSSLDAGSLMGVVEACHGLVRLDVSRNNLGSSGARDLANALRGKHALREVQVRDNQIGDSGSAALGAALETCSAVTEVDVGSNEVSNMGMVRLADALAKCETLEVLRLGRNAMGSVAASALALNLASWKSLTVLDVSFNPIGPEGMEALAATVGQCEQLRQLELAGCPASASLAAIRVAEACGQLAHLDLCQCRLDEEDAVDLAAVLEGKRGLVHLELRGNDLGEEGVGRVAGVLGACEALAHLGLSKNKVGDGGTVRLARSFGVGAGRMLTRLALGQSGIGDEGAAALAGVLSELWALAALDLHRNAIRDRGACALAAAMQPQGSARRLGWEEVGGVWEEEEGGTLGRRGAGLKLWVHGNEIADQGFSALAERAVAGPLSLLYASQNPVTGRAMQALAQMLLRPALPGGGAGGESGREEAREEHREVQIFLQPEHAKAWEYAALFRALPQCASSTQVTVFPPASEVVGGRGVQDPA